MHSLELKIPPVMVALLVAGLMRILVYAFPAFDFVFPARFSFAATFALAGLVTAAVGIVAFRKAHTTVNPIKVDSTTSLVHSGIYLYTRNPMYLGMLLALIAWGIILENAIAFTGPVLFVIYMNRFQIQPEERALSARYGQEYDLYRQRVRRWI